MDLLHVRIVEAVGLPATDQNGFADPYCDLFLEHVNLSEKTKFNTKKKLKTTDPLWDESFTLLKY